MALWYLLIDGTKGSISKVVQNAVQFKYIFFLMTSKYQPLLLKNARKSYESSLIFW